MESSTGLTNGLNKWEVELAAREIKVLSHGYLFCSRLIWQFIAQHKETIIARVDYLNGSVRGGPNPRSRVSPQLSRWGRNGVLGNHRPSPPCLQRALIWEECLSDASQILNIQLTSDLPALMTPWLTVIVADTSTIDFASMHVYWPVQFLPDDVKLQSLFRSNLPLSSSCLGLHTVETQKFRLSWLASKHSVRQRHNAE
ncbi:hypothetical protein VTN96DRAFT_8960 [Rasamsonia emersonii]